MSIKNRSPIKEKGLGYVLIFILLLLCFIIVISQVIFKIYDTPKIINNKTKESEIIQDTTILKNKFGIQCVDGFQVIKIHNTTYFIGTAINSWGDIKGLPCKNPEIEEKK